MSASSALHIHNNTFYICIIQPVPTTVWFSSVTLHGSWQSVFDILLYSLVWLFRRSNPRSTTLEANTVNITPPIMVLLFSLFFFNYSSKNEYRNDHSLENVHHSKVHRYVPKYAIWFHFKYKLTTESIPV